MAAFDTMQDEDLAKQDLRDQSRLEDLRRPWEPSWAEIDERFPDGAGRINGISPGQLRGQCNYDSTHVTSLDRFKAAMRAITTPEERDYIRPRFLDPELQKLRSVQLWCEAAGARLYAIRHASHTGFGIAADEDWDQLGRYGTSAVWQETRPRGMLYACINLSESFIDVDFAGRINRHHRKMEKTARQCEELFGLDDLTPKMRDALQPNSNKENDKFELLHVVCPNTQWDRDRADHRRFPIASRYLAVGEKLYVRRAGYHTMPVSASRHTTSAGEIYGRSPAFKVMPNIQGVNAMKKTTLRAAHKAVDPALIFFDDAGVTSLASKPGGLNPGLVDEMGRPMVARMPGGENGIPFALEMIQDEQNTIRTAFLEEFYKILTDPNSRMTTTEVLEVMSKQGVLVRPFASRYATEKQDPMTQRDLDLALREDDGFPPLPPEVREEGAWPVIDYENMLAAMARAESSAKTMRWMEGLVPFANVQADILDAVDADAVAQGLAAEIGVKPSYVRTPEQIAAIREGRKANEQASIDTELLAKSAGAVKDLAQAGSYEEAA